MKNFTFKLDEELMKQFRIRAIELEKNQQELIEMFIKEGLRKKDFQSELNIDNNK